MPPKLARGATCPPRARISPGSLAPVSANPAALRSRSDSRLPGRPVGGFQRGDDLLGDPLEVLDPLSWRARQAVNAEPDAVQSVLVAGALDCFDAIGCRTMDGPIVETGRRIELQVDHAC